MNHIWPLLFRSVSDKSAVDRHNKRFPRKERSNNVVGVNYNTLQIL